MAWNPPDFTPYRYSFFINATGNWQFDTGAVVTHGTVDTRLTWDSKGSNVEVVCELMQLSATRYALIVVTEKALHWWLLSPSTDKSELVPIANGTSTFDRPRLIDNRKLHHPYTKRPFYIDGIWGWFSLENRPPARMAVRSGNTILVGPYRLEWLRPGDPKQDYHNTYYGQRDAVAIVITVKANTLVVSRNLMPLIEGDPFVEPSGQWKGLWNRHDPTEGVLVPVEGGEAWFYGNSSELRPGWDPETGGQGGQWAGPVSSIVKYRQGSHTAVPTNLVDGGLGVGGGQPRIHGFQFTRYPHSRRTHPQDQFVVQGVPTGRGKPTPMRPVSSYYPYGVDIIKVTGKRRVIAYTWHNEMPAGHDWGEGVVAVFELAVGVPPSGLTVTPLRGGWTYYYPRMVRWGNTGEFLIASVSASSTSPVLTLHSYKMGSKIGKAPIPLYAETNPDNPEEIHPGLARMNYAVGSAPKPSRVFSVAALDRRHAYVAWVSGINRFDRGAMPAAASVCTMALRRYEVQQKNTDVAALRLSASIDHADQVWVP